jgi:hypothetical protein
VAVVGGVVWAGHSPRLSRRRGRDHPGGGLS